MLVALQDKKVSISGLDKRFRNKYSAFIKKNNHPILFTNIAVSITRITE